MKMKNDNDDGKTAIMKIVKWQLKITPRMKTK